MLFNNRRVEEELERIKKANLPPIKPGAEVAKANETTEAIENTETTESIDGADVKITAKDILAMIIAAFSIILPYAAIFIGVTILFVLFFFR